MFFRRCAASKRLSFPILRRPSLIFLLLSFVTAAVFVQLTPLPVRAEETLIISVVLNGQNQGDYFVVRTTDNDFLLKKADLEAFPLPTTGGRQILFEGEPHISLRSLPALTLAFDDKTLTLSISAPVQPPPRKVFDLSPPPPQQKLAYHPRETSAFLNYGLTYSYQAPESRRSFTATDKLGIRSGDLLFLTDSQYTRTDEEDNVVRLMSNLTYERREDLQWFVAGDMFASSGELGSAVNLGGLGVMKVYRMDPYLIRQPTFNFVGLAPAASQVELYLDGILVNKQTVLPGEFELKNFNYYGGGRTAEVLIRDPYGNVQKFITPVYFSDSLLSEGLHEYSYNLGFLREQYGLRSNRYGKLAFSAFHRYGLNKSLTLGASAESTAEISEAALQANQLFPQAGVVSASIAGSRENSQLGEAASLSHTLQYRQIGTNFRLRGYSRDYVTLNPRPLANRIRFEAQAGVNLSTKNHGGFTVGYSETKNYSGSTQRATSLTHSRSISKSLWAMLTARFTRETASGFELLATLNYIPGDKQSCNLRYQHTDDNDSGALQLQKSPPVGEGFGYRANLEYSRTDAAETTTFNPFGQYNGPYGIYSTDATLQWLNGDSAQRLNANAAGSLLYSGGFVGLSRPVSDSFSFVFADGLADVKVLLNNQEIGTTDRSGQMIIPTMSSYHLNQVAIDSGNISMDYSMSGVNANISPSPWGGSCLSFGVVELKAVTGMLTAIKDGESKPVEFHEVSMAVGNRVLKFPTGKGGEFYFENTFPEELKQATTNAQNCAAIAERHLHGRNVIVPGNYAASVDYEEQTCRFTLTIPTTEDAITDLGVIECDLPVPP